MAGPDTINFFNIDNLLDPFEMGRERTAVGLARPLGRSPARLVASMLSLSQCRLDFLQSKLELIGIELFGSAAETMALQGVDDRLQALDFSLENLEGIELAGLFEDKRAERFDVLGQVRFHEHEGSESVVKSPVNRQSVGRSAVARHAPGASPGLPAKRRVARPSGA